MSDAPVNLPALNVRCGQPVEFSLQWTQDDGTPVDLTTWTARFAIAESLDGAAIIDIPDADIDMNATGDVVVEIDGDTTALLQPYICGCLWFQLDILDATERLSVRFQGKVKPFARIEA
jgi:hypothetical protein